MRIAISAVVAPLAATVPSLAQGQFVDPKSPRCVSAAMGRSICIRRVGNTCPQ